MTGRTQCRVAWLGVLACWALPGQEEYRLDSGRFVLFGEERVAEAEFRRAALQARALRQLRAEPERRLVVLWQRPEGGAEVGWLKNYDSPSYGSAEWQFRQKAEPRRSRLVKAGADAVLEIQWNRRRMERVVLAGEDPLRRRVRGRAVRVVEVLPGDQSARVLQVRAGLPELGRLQDLRVLAVVDGAPDCETAEELGAWWRALTVSREVSVELSDSPWFINVLEAPGRWPFVEGARFPSRGQHLRTRSVHVWIGPERRSCRAMEPF